MRPRVARHVAYLGELLERLQRHVQARLMGDVDLGDPSVVRRLIDGRRNGEDLTLSGLAREMERGESPIDPDWLGRVSDLLSSLQELRSAYLGGTTGRGRARMGMVNATGCTSVWGSTYPFNPYPFPWTNHLFQDAPSVAMGVFEGHMANMAQGFRTIRMAELELAGRYEPATHEPFFRTFGWEQFTDQEWALCPPVVAVGGDGAMYDIGFQNLSRLLASMKPIKVLVLDTQVYSNTGGQACTSGFIGQISDMAQFGAAQKGKSEPRKEIGLIGMAHRTTYVAQSTIAHANHMIESFIRGLNARRPALFNIYTSCQPEHGIGDDMARHQAKLAVESRAYPLFRYDPDAGETPEECFDLEGNPAVGDDWPTYVLAHGGKRLELPMTFADFALTEARFRKHFRVAPPDAWSPRMVPLAELLTRAPEDRGDLVPYVWATDPKGKLQRLVVDQTMVRSAEDRRAFWRMLRGLAGVRPAAPSREEIAAEVRREVVTNLAENLLRLAGDDGRGTARFGAGALGGSNGGVAATLGGSFRGEGPARGDGAATMGSASSASSNAQPRPFLAPWIDSDDCTSCDECIQINAKMFAYDDRKKAYLKDPTAGPYRDLVKAAERCTARVIHPGLPSDQSEKDIEKWIRRGEKFN